MKQKLYAFWSYDLYPYCLWGEISKFKDNHVYIESYQSWFKPFKIVEGEAGEVLIKALTTLKNAKRHELLGLNKSYDYELKEILPDVFKK